MYVSCLHYLCDKKKRPNQNAVLVVEGARAHEKPYFRAKKKINGKKRNICCSWCVVNRHSATVMCTYVGQRLRMYHARLFKMEMPQELSSDVHHLPFEVAHSIYA